MEDSSSEKIGEIPPGVLYLEMILVQGTFSHVRFWYVSHL